MRDNWILHPERDIYGNGSIVALYYLSDLKEYPLCIIRSYSKYYRIEILDIQKKIVDIYYNNKILKRLSKRLLKKERKGHLTSEQCTKIKLLTLCIMVENHCDLLTQ